MKRTVAIPLAIFGAVAGALLLGMCCIGVGGVFWVLNSSTPAKSNDVDILELIDHPERYAGKTLTLRLHLDEPVNLTGKTLRDLTGKSVRFFTFSGPGGSGARLGIRIDIPSDLPVPNATSGDGVTVTFRCDRGSLTTGNIALSIRR